MSEYVDYVDKPVVAPREPLTPKRAVEFLLEGTLKVKVCKYCLTVNSALTDLDQYLKVTGDAGFYKLTVKDMLACFYPYQVAADSNLPDKVCDDCLDHIISCYLFTQQCERSDRALRNFIEELDERLNKLDPLIRPPTRGRRKAKPNTNTIFISHKRVIDYADPLISLVSQGMDMEKMENKKENELECPKCWQQFNNIEALLNHKKTHPNTMWFYCRYCGLSFAKESFYRKHLNTAHSYQMGTAVKLEMLNTFKCEECGVSFDDYSAQLQHIETHKFKGVMEAVLDKKVDQLCSICFERGRKMVEMDSTVHFHGGYPGLSGRQNLYNVMDMSLPTRKSRYKYRELLLSNTAKVLRMKRKSDMMEDSLNSTKYMDNTRNNVKDVACTKNSILTQPTEDISLSRSQNLATCTSDDLSEFTFSMPIKISTKRRKLDLEISKSNVPLQTQQKPKDQVINRPNFFLFNHSTIKNKQNKSKVMDDTTESDSYKDKHEVINADVKKYSQKESTNNSNNIDNCGKEPINENLSDKIHSFDKDTQEATSVTKLPFNHADKKKNLSMDTVDLPEKNATNQCTNTKDSSGTSKKDQNCPKIEVDSNKACTHEWTFANASVIIKNVASSVLRLVEKELSNYPESVSFEFTFDNPIKYSDNGKQYLCQKPLIDGNVKIVENATSENSEMKDETHSKNSNKFQKLKSDVENLDSTKAGCDENMENLNTQPHLSEKSKCNEGNSSDLHDKIDNINKSETNNNVEGSKSVYPAILTDFIKVPDSNVSKNKIDALDNNKDSNVDKHSLPCRSTKNLVLTKEDIKKDIFKESNFTDNGSKMLSDSIESTFRKRKCSESSAQKKQSWDCIYCFTNNEPHRVSCFCCGSVKDASKCDIIIDFGTNKKRRLDEIEKDKSSKENNKKHEENIAEVTKRAPERPLISFALPKSENKTSNEISQSIPVSENIIPTISVLSTVPSTIPIPTTVTTLSTSTTLLPTIIPPTFSIPPTVTTLSTIATTPATTTSSVITASSVISTASPNTTIPTITTVAANTTPSTLTTPTVIAIPSTTLTSSTTITTSPILSFPLPKNSLESKNPINPIPFSTTPLFQFGKPKTTDEKKEKSTTELPQLFLQPTEKGAMDKTSVPVLPLQPSNVETDKTVKSFNFSDTTNKGIFQFGKLEAKKESITVSQIPEQKFGTSTNITASAKPQITSSMLEDIDMTEVADVNTSFNAPITGIPQAPSIMNPMFQTPNVLMQPFQTEQKTTPTTFKGFGGFSTPLPALSETKPTFETPAIQSPFQFGNNLNFSIGSAPVDNKGNTNAARKPDRKIRTARRRCT